MKPERRSGTRQIVRIQVIMPILQMESCDTIGMALFLNKKNEEKWIQSTQLKNPIIEVKEKAFAVGDIGGNSILVFSEEGLKGEIETSLPIENMAISDQGIVTVLLKMKLRRRSFLMMQWAMF